MSDEDQKLILINMCPEELRKHFKREVHRWEKYNDVLIEVHDYMGRMKSPGAQGAKSLLERVTEDEYDIELEEDMDESINSIPAEFHDQIMALVKNAKFGKKGGKGKKGGGKKGSESSTGGGADASAGSTGTEFRRGKGPPSSENPCHGCGGHDHFLKDCPQKGKDKGKGKAEKGAPWPTQRQWGTMYPGPSKPTWSSWWPGGKGSGGGKAFQGQP
jgi:hypothetical protein